VIYIAVACRENLREQMGAAVRGGRRRMQDGLCSIRGRRRHLRCFPGKSFRCLASLDLMGELLAFQTLEPRRPRATNDFICRSKDRCGRRNEEQMTKAAISTESVNLEGFDYSKLDDHVAKSLKARAQLIKDEIRNQTGSILITGRLLIEAKSALPHGQFSRWVIDEIHVSIRTAENYVRAASVASECESEMISLLAPTTLYFLAAMPPDAKSKELKALEDIDAKDLKEFEDRIRRSCARKNERASDESNSDQLQAAEEIATLLKGALEEDKYRHFCELGATLCGIGRPKSLPLVLRDVFDLAST
jgi:hypothetical protein